MGRLQIVLSDTVEKQFRDEISKGLGFKKGNISIAVEEAIITWINAKKEKRSNVAKKAWETRKTKK